MFSLQSLQSVLQLIKWCHLQMYMYRDWPFVFSSKPMKTSSYKIYVTNIFFNLKINLVRLMFSKKLL